MQEHDDRFDVLPGGVHMQVRHSGHKDELRTVVEQ